MELISTVLIFYGLTNVIILSVAFCARLDPVNRQPSVEASAVKKS